MVVWPQLLTICWLIVGGAISIHVGSRKCGAFVNIACELSSRLIIIIVLWAGGFWAPLGYAP